MNASLRFLLDRAREPSSWRGVVWLLSAFGAVISPEQTAAIMAGGAAIAGLIAVFTKDPAPPAAET